MKNPRLGCGGQKTTRQGELYADPTLCDKIVKGPQDIFIQVAHSSDIRISDKILWTSIGMVRFYLEFYAEFKYGWENMKYR